MALVRYEEERKKVSFPTRNRHDLRHKLPELKDAPTIDYSKMKSLCDLVDKNGHELNDAHKYFMENYKEMFVQPPKKLGFPIHSEKRSEKKSTLSEGSTKKATGTKFSEKSAKKKSYPVDNLTHNIKDYLPLLHQERKSEDPVSIYAENIRTLRRVLKKLPFERTAADNDKIYSILKKLPFFSDKIPNNILKELCVVAVLETWKDENFTVFGSSGIHMILRGKVKPLSDPCLYVGDEPLPKNETPLPGENEDSEQKSTGDVFGTLKKIEGREPGSRFLSVITVEPNCEFLKISVSDYCRVIEQIRQREQTEKLNLLLSCEQYKLWPRQPLLSVANLIEWVSYPPNTVLASEGYQAPYIAVIKSGECHVLRQVEVLHSTKSGKKEKKTKQVVMGKLSTSDSFAEISVLLDEPITCSVVTATDVELGIIKPERIAEVDEVTVQLFKQSNSRTFGDLTKEKIQEEYMEQEIKREWNQFKHNVVVNVINYKGIRPGYGKWAK